MKKKNILNEELCIFNRQLTSCLYIFRVRNIIKHQNIDQYYDALIFRNWRKYKNKFNHAKNIAKLKYWIYI